MLLGAVCAYPVFGAQTLTGCLADIEAATAHSAAGRSSESEHELARIIAQLPERDGLCLGIASGDMAALLQRRGDIAGAGKYAHQAVAALETAGPDYQMALARPLQVLAETYLGEQRFAKAKEVLARLETLPAPSRRDRAAQAGMRASIDVYEGRWDDAEGRFGAAIKLWEEIGEGDNISIVPELGNLALLYLNRQRFADAAPLLERARRILDASKEATSEQRLTVMTNLGVLYANKRDWRAAGEFLRRALEIADAAAAVDVTARRRLYGTYALVLRRSGQKREAKQFQAKAEALLPSDPSSMTVDAQSVAGRRH
jgi:tetratricopeptide (TPR) repeat protein